MSNLSFYEEKDEFFGHNFSLGKKGKFTKMLKNHWCKVSHFFPLVYHYFFFHFISLDFLILIKRAVTCGIKPNLVYNIYIKTFVIMSTILGHECEFVMIEK